MQYTDTTCTKPLLSFGSGDGYRAGPAVLRCPELCALPEVKVALHDLKLAARTLAPPPEGDALAAIFERAVPARVLFLSTR